MGAIEKAAWNHKFCLLLPYDRQNLKGRDSVYMEFQNCCWHQIDPYIGICSKQNSGCWIQLDFQEQRTIIYTLVDLHRSRLDTTSEEL